LADKNAGVVLKVPSFRRFKGGTPENDSNHRGLPMFQQQQLPININSMIKKSLETTENPLNK